MIYRRPSIEIIGDAARLIQSAVGINEADGDHGPEILCEYDLES